MCKKKESYLILRINLINNCSQQFGGSAFAIQNAMGCTIEKANEFAEAYSKGFPGIAKFKEKGSKEVRNNGYIVLNPITGHKTYWATFNKWKREQENYTSKFWEEYRNIHKPNKDDVFIQVKEHFKEVSKWDRKALNSVTQGTGAIILKDSQIKLFHWVVENGYFGKCRLANLTHDECNWEFPENLTNFPKIVEDFMEKSASKYCKSVPVPAVAEVSDHWVH